MKHLIYSVRGCQNVTTMEAEPKIVKIDENVSAVMSDIEATQLLPANVTN